MGLVEEDRLHSEVVSQLQVQSERLAVAERNHERLLNRMERRALYKKQISLLQTSISLVNLVTPTSVLSTANSSTPQDSFVSPPAPHNLQVRSLLSLAQNQNQVFETTEEHQQTRSYWRRTPLYRI